MSIPVNINGDATTYNVPQKNDTNFSTGASGETAFQVAIVTALNNRILTSGIIDNLSSTSTTNPLSANQGHVLNAALALKTNISDIVDNLLSTSAVVPLSANQGRILSIANNDTRRFSLLGV